jgi:folate-binding protein YgfZ
MSAHGTWPDRYGEGPAAESVAREYEAARTGCALSDLPDRALLVVTGPTRLKFVHNLVSNDVASLAPGQGRRAALMDVKGHLLAVMRVLATEDALRIELPAARRAHVQALFEHYRVAAPVRFQAPSDAMVALLGPEARRVLAAVGCEVPELAAEAHVERRIDDVPVRVVRASDVPGAALVLHLPAESAATLWRRLTEAGAQPLGRLALDALRIEEGRPWFGVDVTEANLLHETGLVKELHSPTKGCYVGQEVVARLEGRGGNVNRALRGLRLRELAAAGAEITADGKAVGTVTTAALSPRLGPVAMGYVHRSRFEPGTVVQVGGLEATVTALPFPA